VTDLGSDQYPASVSEIAKAVQLLDLVLEFLPTTTTGRAAVMTTDDPFASERLFA